MPLFRAWHRTGVRVDAGTFEQLPLRELGCSRAGFGKTVQPRVEVAFEVGTVLDAADGSCQPSVGFAKDARLRSGHELPGGDAQLRFSMGQGYAEDGLMSGAGEPPEEPCC